MLLCTVAFGGHELSKILSRAAMRNRAIAGRLRATFSDVFSLKGGLDVAILAVTGVAGAAPRYK